MNTVWIHKNWCWTSLKRQPHNFLSVDSSDNPQNLPLDVTLQTEREQKNNANLIWWQGNANYSREAEASSWTQVCKLYILMNICRSSFSWSLTQYKHIKALCDIKKLPSFKNLQCLVHTNTQTSTCSPVKGFPHFFGIFKFCLFFVLLSGKMNWIIWNLDHFKKADATTCLERLNEASTHANNVSAINESTKMTVCPEND